MRFDDLDAAMRVYETAHDYSVLPRMWIVVRLDGRSFTRLTKEVHRFAHPFDERFRDLMVATTTHLLDRGLKIVYGYTQSDEISLLLHPDDDSFGRKTRKLISILAGEASAKFSLLLGDLGVFDGRGSELPAADLVVDYFRWRQEDAHRNAINGHCYWLLRDQGLSPRTAHARLRGVSVAAKHELLFTHGINVNDLPAWQKRGVGLVWETYTRLGTDPRTGQQVPAVRRRIATELELPFGVAYGRFIAEMVEPLALQP